MAEWQNPERHLDPQAFLKQNVCVPFLSILLFFWPELLLYNNMADRLVVTGDQ